VYGEPLSKLNIGMPGFEELWIGLPEGAEEGLWIEEKRTLGQPHLTLHP